MSAAAELERSARAGFSLAELAVRFGLEIQGDPEVRVSHVASIEHADPGSLTFLANAKLHKFLAQTRASAVLVAPGDAQGAKVAALIHDDPYVCYTRIAALLHPRRVFAPGVHASAIVAPGVKVPASVYVGPLSIIEESVELGDNVEIGPHCLVERGARIGSHTRLLARVTVCERVQIGARCLVHPGAVIGGEGFGFAPMKPGWLRVPQVGTVRIGNDVDIGCNTTIDRGAIGDTDIGDGVKLDNLIQIGHNVKIGEHSIMAACCGVGGSTVIGKRCAIGGLTGFTGHITVVDDVTVTGKSMVTASLLKAGVYSSGFPAEPARAWWRRVALLRKISAGRNPSAAKDTEHA